MASECSDDLDLCRYTLVQLRDKHVYLLNQYDTAINALSKSSELIRELQKTKKNNILFPFVGFRFTEMYIYPDIGLGYIRSIKKVGFKRKFFYLGAGGMFDVSFNGSAIKSIGVNLTVAFLF